jgi:hypothetical protein
MGHLGIDRTHSVSQFDWIQAKLGRIERETRARRAKVSFIRVL